MPTRPDRNLAIERLLRDGHAAPAGAAADACIPAEELAAWVDGGLPAADSARVEAHLASCAACQALLAAFARTGSEAAAAPSRSPMRVLLPLAAAAVLVVGVWLAGTRPEQRPIPVPAERQAARVDLPPTTLSAPSQPPGDTERLNDDREVARFADRSAAARVELRAPDAIARSEATAQRRQAAATATADKAVAATPPLPIARATAAPAAAAPAAAESAAPLRQEAPPSEPQPSRVDGFSAARLALARAVEPRLPLASPDGVSRWRIVGSALDVSADGGATWVPAIGVTSADLANVLSGASPARAVSWLVGRGGLVLLTTDGRRFTRASAPAPAVLTGVEPEDGAIAAVRAADGRAWRTIDAGRTWQPIQ